MVIFYIQQLITNMMNTRFILDMGLGSRGLGRWKEPPSTEQYGDFFTRFFEGSSWGSMGKKGIRGLSRWNPKILDSDLIWRVKILQNGVWHDTPFIILPSYSHHIHIIFPYTSVKFHLIPEGFYKSEMIQISSLDPWTETYLTAVIIWGKQ